MAITHPRLRAWGATRPGLRQGQGQERVATACALPVASLSAQRSAFAARARQGKNRNRRQDARPTDCTRSGCVCVFGCVCVSEIFARLFSTTLEPNRAKGGCQRVFHSSFLQKKLHFCRCRCCCFSCAVACQSGSEGVGVCVHSAVEHCPVRWLLPMEWAGRKEDSKGHPTQSNILTKVV